MKIGIIGTGRMGGGLGKAWASKGHEIAFGSRDPQKGRALGQTLGGGGGSLADAVRFGDAILLATPWTTTETAIREAGSFSDKVLIDCTNPLGADMSLALGFTTSAAEEIAKWARGARVVKAFNTVFSQVVENPRFGTEAPALFYCGDDAAAKQTAAGLIRDAGFEPVDAGPLKSARTIEPLAGLMIHLAYGQGMGPGVALKFLRR